MRIALDARWVFRDLGGIRRHTLGLLRHLVELGDEYLLIVAPEHDPAPLAGLAAELVPVPYGPFSPANQLRLPAELSRLGVDLFHSPNFMAPLLPGRVPLVITVHDLIPYLHPEWAVRSKKTRFHGLYRALTRRAVDRATRVITVSEHSCGDLARCFPEAAAKVRVVPNGFELSDEPAVDWDPLAERLGLHAPVLLYVGRQDPSKNLPRLIQAFATVRAGHEAQLVLAGAPHPDYPEPREVAASLGLGDAVVFTGVLTDGELRALYQGARGFVFPSLYEGFGLPVLEAMAAGCPVVTTTASSLPEVAGDAAILVDPNDTAALAAAMIVLLEDEPRRQALITAGYERVKQFSWRAAAEATRAVYAEAVEAAR